MTAPIKSDPPYVPMRSGGWPKRKAPRWAIASGVVLLGFGVAVGLAHHPSNAQRGSDLAGVLQNVSTDIGSCAAGVREALQAMSLLTATGATAGQHITIAINEADYGAANCSPANNDQIGELTTFQLPESLASYHLQPGITGLIDWAVPDAQRVQSDVAQALTDRGKPAEAADLARLHRDLAALDAKRAAVYSVFRPAIRALSPGAALPVLPG